MEIKRFPIILEPPLKRVRLQQQAEPDRMNLIAQGALVQQAILPAFNRIMQPIDPAILNTHRISPNLLSRPIGSNSVTEETNPGQQNERETPQANQSLELAPFNPDSDINPAYLE